MTTHEDVERGDLHSVIEDRLYICNGKDVIPEGNSVRHFRPNELVHYDPFCDDFGPMGLASIVAFVRQLDDALQDETRMLIYVVGESRRELTNAIFLLGCFLMLLCGHTVDQVAQCFAWADYGLAELYRDATFTPSSFGLTLRDCWSGLARGMDLGWLAAPDNLDHYEWGAVDVDEYAHYDQPGNGDLTEVVPGKFIAFKGPRHLAGGANYRDDPVTGARDFAPTFYADVLADHVVSDVVRLNEPQYDPAPLVAAGMAFHDLEFPDCTAPPPHVVDAFLRLADATPGAVAVHCKAGLGRTGTLIALWLMRRKGFSAREAMGWLRIMRPGCVIGEQQHYLCAVERRIALHHRQGKVDSDTGACEPQGYVTNALEEAKRDTAAAAGRGCEGAAEAARQAAEVAAGMDRRAATRLNAVLLAVSPPLR